MKVTLRWMRLCLLGSCWLVSTVVAQQAPNAHGTSSLLADEQGVIRSTPPLTPGLHHPVVGPAVEQFVEPTLEGRPVQSKPVQQMLDHGMPTGATASSPGSARTPLFSAPSPGNGLGATVGAAQDSPPASLAAPAEQAFRFEHSIPASTLPDIGWHAPSSPDYPSPEYPVRFELIEGDPDVLERAFSGAEPTRPQWVPLSESFVSFAQDDEGVPPSPEDYPGEVTGETFGVEPADYTRQFLRTQTVLLQPGEWQFDYGLTYLLDETNFPDLASGNLVRTDVRRRILFAPFAIRYGLLPRLQLFSQIPVGWGHTELSNPIADARENSGGIGDIRLGLNYLLRQGDYCSPDVVLTFQTTLPTSEKSLPVGTTATDPGVGVWAASTQLLFVQAYDPVTAFWGLGYRYQWEDRFGDLDVFLGHQFSYNFGVGFAVNDRVTLSTTFLGLYQTETEVNGDRIPGSTQEPLQLRFAITAYRNCRIIEPFATIGMTESAPNAQVGITWTY